MGARTLLVERLGLVPYAAALALQARAAERVRAGDPPGADRLLLLEHPPVVTLGRGADPAHLLASPEALARRGVEVHAADRGGDVTWHGPGQAVAWPVVDLRDRPDVRRWVGDLEEAMIRACADFGVAAGRRPGLHGAWVGPRKVGAVGVRIEGWLSTHGLALNVSPDLSQFGAIVPCGIADPSLGVTSLAAELAPRGRPPPGVGAVHERLAHHLAALLGRARRDAPGDPPPRVAASARGG